MHPISGKLLSTHMCRHAGGVQPGCWWPATTCAHFVVCSPGMLWATFTQDQEGLHTREALPGACVLCCRWRPEHAGQGGGAVVQGSPVGPQGECSRLCT